MLCFNKHPLVIFDTSLNTKSRSGEATHALLQALHDDGMRTLIAESAADCLNIIKYENDLRGIILDWDSFGSDPDVFADYLQQIKLLNNQIPIFVITQLHELDDSSAGILQYQVHFFWKYADTNDFSVGRIRNATEEYLISLLPPFFKALLIYTSEHKYAWSTPGHMGGVAFLKSPVGRIFYDFYGENVFRGDASISVPELGSLMEHQGVNAKSEQLAAKVFGADHTYFVTNGTSTSNKMVVMSCAAKGDIALIDRNCHKSLQHALTMSDVIPIYLNPTRNAYGIIGTIPLHEFTPEAIMNKIQASPLIQDKSLRPNLVVVTNSTYDGLIYNVDKLKDELAKSNIMHLHFDEAWYPYAHFHPLYNGRHAMSTYQTDYHPTIYSTQSTHKLLAAFSQASMIHIKNGIKPLNTDLFNETYMMHTSTSPQYNIIASLDVATKMMEGQMGYRIISEAISEAIAFRQEFSKIRNNVQDDWFFKLWQPNDVLNISSDDTEHFMNITANDATTWTLNPKDSWHGFKNIGPNYTMLDPIKVTILTPGLLNDCSFEKTGIPAPIVSRYLMNKGVVDEKTSFYSMLFLFSIGVNKSKSMNLLRDLVAFKEAYDQNKLLEEIFPRLMLHHAKFYRETGVADLCAAMHDFLKNAHASKLLTDVYAILPQQVITPNQAYQHIIKETCIEVPLEQLQDKVILTMIAPYPPGIPIVMPGEKITAESSKIINYLQLLEHFDNTFPGFENEVHGINIRIIHGRRKYFVNCLV